MRKLNITLILCVVLLLTTNILHASAKKARYLEPGEKVITEQQMLEGLSQSDWKKISEFIGQWEWTIHREDYFASSPAIKAKLIELLKEAHKYREDKIIRIIKDGKSPDEAANTFKKDNYMTEYPTYLKRLTFIIWNYNDPETLPLIVKTNVIYESDAFTLNNYLRHFGKKAFIPFIDIIHGKDSKEKAEVYGYLGSWAGRVILGNHKSEMRLKNEDKLNDKEINVVKKEFIKALEENNDEQVRKILKGLEVFAQYPTNNEEKDMIKAKLIKRLNSKDISIRAEIARILGEIGNKNDIGELSKLINDPELNPAMEHLRKIQMKNTGKSDLPKEYPVRDAARQAIEQIEKREMGKNEK